MKRKILQLITLSEAGGAQRVVYHLAKGLDKNRFEVTVACAPGGELVSWLQSVPGVKVIELPELVREISPLRDIRALAGIVRLIKSNKYDIVHCHSSKAGALGRLAARIAGVGRVIFTVHGWSFANYSDKVLQKVFILLEKFLQRFTDITVCVSRETARSGEATGILHGWDHTVILNGVEAARDIASGTLRKELGLKASDVLVGTVCRLAPPKLPLLFIGVARKVLRDNHRAKFVIIGDGPLFEQCSQKINEYGLQKNVFMLGLRDDVPELLTDLDVFVLLSDSEGLPMSVLEAMSAGRPVIASDVGGVKEAVTDGINGFLVDNMQVDEIAEKIHRLTTDRELRIRMGQESYKRITAFTVDSMVSMYEAIYIRQGGHNNIRDYK